MFLARTPARRGLPALALLGSAARADALARRAALCTDEDHAFQSARGWPAGKIPAACDAAEFEVERASWRADALEICEGGICALVICEGYVRLRSTAAGYQCAEVAIQFRQARQIGFIFAMLRSRELEDRSSLTNNLL